MGCFPAAEQNKIALLDPRLVAKEMGGGEALDAALCREGLRGLGAGVSKLCRCPLRGGGGWHREPGISPGSFALPPPLPGHYCHVADYFPSPCI